MKQLLGLLLTIFLLGACAEKPAEEVAPAGGSLPVSSPSAFEEDPAVDPVPGELNGPPPVTIEWDGGTAELQPWTFCYENGCADGAPPEDLVDVGSPEEVFITYPLDEWRFRADFTPSDERCGRHQTVRTEQIEPGRMRLIPAGYAGTYDVTLMGRGGGDLFVTFQWTTPTDGPLPTPRARAAIIAGHDGEVDSYGIEIMLNNLATTPKKATATVKVTSAEGESVTFEAERAKGCWPEGTVYWDGPDAKGLEAAGLGSAPFTYEIEVSLDGERYEASATWPDDAIKGNEPSVSLRFSPDLPRLQ